MKRHYHLKNRKRFFSILIILSVLLSTILFATSAYGYEGQQYETITVQSGDTLWSIAEKYCRSGDIRKYIYEIKKANHLSSSAIFAGDELLVPQ